MATSPQRRQKQLAKKKVKRKAMVSAKKMVDKFGGLFSQAAFKNVPIYECLAPSELFELGIGTVVIARKMPNGDIGVSFFMLDVFCLGVKNAFFAEFTLQEYRQKLWELGEHESMQTISPACARKLIEDCAVYAKNLGFSPVPDYTKAKMVFGDTKADECPEDFEFGKDGKPLYVIGPFDTPEKSKKILKQLDKTCGQGEFHYVTGVEPFDEEKEFKT
ncbi:MAG: hypothetical protein DRR19_04225 [Candidatus Parabeggiatoa sp. nov. 1]|nr:MAG: hypothetical protein DRR19_04225 [Gammaproteobacteria bacterium]